ncbi:MAG: sulfotransferase family 2 domain-containing protein [Chloroflexota bacterium]
MIISHKHRYLFVELPRTGSTAVRRELRELYDGEPILHKHATYEEFAAIATEDERRYFVFSSIRNPLDDAVSRYFKFRTDHKGRYTDPARQPKHKPFVNRVLDESAFRFVRRGRSDFGGFLRRFYPLPFDTWASLSHDRFDLVMRFERLTDDFAEALRLIGVEPVRPLPVANQTGQRDRDFSTYYDEGAQRHARRVFGPYMRRWGYELPPSWELAPPSRWHEAQYATVSAVGGLYWRHLRPRIVGRNRARHRSAEPAVTSDDE